MGQSIEIEIKGEEGLLKANQLANFLYYFRAAYFVAVDRFGNVPVDQLRGHELYFRSEMQKAIAESLNRRKVWELCFADLGDNELLVNAISRNSPYKILSMGLITALVLAVIVSGGEVDLYNGKFVLNPLGEGIAALRDAFNPPDQTFSPSP